ncbi:MAG: hypothetical protein ACRCUT_07005, partial [Spirochaetota bacterium]
MTELVIFLLNLSVVQFYGIMVNEGVYHSYPWYALTSRPLQLMVGPLFYLYIRVLTCSAAFGRKDLIHFILPFLMALYYLPQLIVTEAPFLYAVRLVFPGAVQSSVSLFFCYLFELQLLAYIIASVKILYANEKKIVEYFSDIEGRNLSWVRFLLSIMIPLCAVLIVLTVYEDLSTKWAVLPKIECLKAHFLSPIISFVMVFFIGYKGIRQSEISSRGFDGSEGADSVERWRFPDEKIRETAKRLEEVMKEKTPYSDPDLTLPMLAEMTGLSRNLISTV